MFAACTQRFQSTWLASSSTESSPVWFSRSLSKYQLSAESLTNSKLILTSRRENHASESSSVTLRTHSKVNQSLADQERHRGCGKGKKDAKRDVWLSKHHLLCQLEIKVSSYQSKFHIRIRDYFRCQRFVIAALIGLWIGYWGCLRVFVYFCLGTSSCVQ